MTCLKQAVGVTKAGDLWLAGPHRIYCAETSYSKLFFADGIRFVRASWY